MGGALIRTWTSVAPARRSMPTICLVVVPRTMESSTTMSRRSRTTSRSGLSFTFTPRWRIAWEGWMNVRPLYRLRTIPSRDGHDHVRLDAVLHRELDPHLPAGLVQIPALHVRVGAREVDQLEHAEGRVRLGVRDRDRLAARLEHDDLAGLDVAHVLGADDVQGGRLRREDPAAGPVIPQPRGAVRRGRHRQPAEDERAEPVGVAHADDALLVEDDEAERPADAGQDADERVHGVGGRLVGEEGCEELGVGARRQAPAAALELVEQLPGVDEVPVVPDRERAARTEAERRLRVLPDRRPGGGVAAMRD